MYLFRADETWRSHPHNDIFTHLCCPVINLKIIMIITIISQFRKLKKKYLKSSLPTKYLLRMRDFPCLGKFHSILKSLIRIGQLKIQWLGINLVYCIQNYLPMEVMCNICPGAWLLKKHPPPKKKKKKKRSEAWKRMVGKVISELKSVSRFQIFPETGLWYLKFGR